MKASRREDRKILQAFEMNLSEINRIYKTEMEEEEMKSQQKQAGLSNLRNRSA